MFKRIVSLFKQVASLLRRKIPFFALIFEKENLKQLRRNKVLIAGSTYINGIIYVENNGSICIGKNFHANSGLNFNPIGGDTILRLISFTKDSAIIIGDNVGISNSTLVAWEKIQIGNNVMIGGGVRIWDTNFHSLDPFTRTTSVDDDVSTAPVIIDDYVFIGGGTMIMKGVHIGKNSIIAAGSVVTKNIPENVIAGGNPCRVIKSLNV